MQRTYVAQQLQLLHMARKITLTKPENWLWAELATQLFLAAAPSCRAARSRRALHLHSVRAAPSREQLLVVMREQFTFPWAARRNFGAHSFDTCLLMTFLCSANLARPAEGIFMRQQHNATLVPTHCWRLISAMLPAASTSGLSAAVKALHRARNQRIRLIKDGILPQEIWKETWDFQRICTGFVTVAPRGQRLGERHRRTAWWVRHSKDTANDHLVQTCLY